ncbi:MAG: HAD family hydrolase [Chloroflexi bacterium]|nr:MAG: HAD family hydrolase [Chloroflexota bacterium]
MTPHIRALVFDFDGVILETEMPAFRSWAEIYREHGHELPRDRWLDYIGREAGWFDALAHLESLVTAPFDREVVRRRREERRTKLLAELDVMAGIRDYVAEGRRLGLRLGIASSSPTSYVRTHLGRIALNDVWDAVICREDAPRAKPAPDLYLRAVEVLGVAPEEALALEDSPNGIAAAKDAGLWVVAVPNALTAEGDLSRADCRVSTCAELPLRELLRRLG